MRERGASAFLFNRKFLGIPYYTKRHILLYKKERLGQKTSGRKDLFIRLEVIKTSKILFCLGEM